MILRRSSGQAYVEWLRVRGCLKWTALVLVAGVALLLFGRFTYLDIHPHSKVLSGVQIGDQTFAQFEASSKETTATLADGTVRTVIDNPAHGMRITIDDRGYWGKHVELFEKKPPPGAEVNTLNFGDVHFTRVMVPGGSLVKIDEGAALPEDFNYYFVLAAFVAMVVATVLGAPFARENENHLEIALTKPVSRVRQSFNAIAADAIGIAAGWAMTVVFLMVGHTIFEAPNYAYGPNDTFAIVLGLLGAFAWYAMLNAATASMKRAYGAVLGVAWPVAWGIHAISVAKLGDTPVAQVVHDLTATLARIDPVTYLHFGQLFATVPLSGPMGAASAQISFTSDVIVLAVLALVYGALAILQWQRVEA